jgi:NACalpha-BTF3-like transcription factor
MAAPQALTPEQIQQIIAAGRGNTVNIGGTLYGANYADTGSGETLQEGALAGITGSTGIDAAGQPFYSYDPSGAFTGQGTTTKSQSFFGGLADAFKDPVVLAALAGGYGAGLFGGGAGAAGAGATAGMSAAELAQLDLALGGAGGSAGAAELAAALNTGAATTTLTNLTGGSGVTTGAAAGITADSVAAKLAADAGLTTAAGATTSGLTAAQIANLAKAGISLAGLTAGANALTNTGGTKTTTPTPVTYSGGGGGGYSPDYFSQVQSNYNSLMPNVPRDVASPLQNWYSTQFNPGGASVAGLFGDMTGGTTAGGMTPTTAGGVKPVTTLPPTVKPPVVVPPVVTPPITTVPTTTVPTTTTPATVVNPGSAGYQYATTQLGLKPAEYLNNINQWILDNPRASRDQIDAVMAKAGVSQADLQEALRTTTFSDATKYALTHGGSLGDLNNTITNYIAQNPTATNAQIQAQQTQYGISDQDIERAMTALNSSPAKEYAVINDMGLNQYYQNIADVAKSGVSAADAAAQMRQYGVSPGDVSKAYGLFAPSGGLTLDEVLAAYNK